LYLDDEPVKVVVREYRRHPIYAPTSVADREEMDIRKGFDLKEEGDGPGSTC
jgi:hypothetical protein